ncbi:hypothetical protein KGY58_02220, partial [Candidatus Bipolaricaulota bacterium]|nr:hypothetical protein [Candidatus Bipolaricaulota bacterium]
TQMRKVTRKYNLPLNEPGSLYRSKVKELEPGSEAHLGAGPDSACKIPCWEALFFPAYVLEALSSGMTI